MHGFFCNCLVKLSIYNHVFLLDVANGLQNNILFCCSSYQVCVYPESVRDEQMFEYFSLSALL